MKHVQAFITASSLTPLLQELRDVPGMPEITIRHQHDGRGEEEVVLNTDVLEVQVALVVAIIRSHSDCIIVVTPQEPSKNSHANKNGVP